MRRFLKADFYRLLTSGQFYIGILGIALVYLICGYQATYLVDVYASYFYNGWFSTAIIIYAFCAVAFSGCFLEDSEHAFWYQIIQRGTIRKYVWSKVIVCFMGAVLVSVLGVLLFSLILRTQIPFVSEINPFIDVQREYDKFGFLLYPNRIVWYFLCASAMNGLLGGIFALLSAYLSLYEKNRIFTISAPVVGFYFLENFFTNNLQLPDTFDIWCIFNSQINLFEKKWMDIVYAIGVSLVAVVILEKLTQRKIVREVYGTKM